MAIDQEDIDNREEEEEERITFYDHHSETKVQFHERQ
jgi:hypothetical protein